MDVQTIATRLEGTEAGLPFLCRGPAARVCVRTTNRRSHRRVHRHRLGRMPPYTEVHIRRMCYDGEARNQALVFNSDQHIPELGRSRVCRSHPRRRPRLRIPSLTEGRWRQTPLARMDRLQRGHWDTFQTSPWKAETSRYAYALDTASGAYRTCRLTQSPWVKQPSGYPDQA